MELAILENQWERSMVLMLVSIASQKRCKSTVFINRNYIAPSFIIQGHKINDPETLKREHPGRFFIL